MNTSLFSSEYGGSLAWEQHGEGESTLFLHSEAGPASGRAFAQALSTAGGVVLPHLPGFGESSPFARLTTMNDVAYLIADFLDSVGIETIAVVGSSLGAWLALELAAIAPQRVSALTLLGPVGIKLSGREERDFADVFALPRAIVTELSYHDPAKAADDFDVLSLEDVTLKLREREALVRFGWKPYLHSTALAQHIVRVRQPALVVDGAADRFVRAGYAADLVAALPDARLVTLDECGHFPDIEQPAEAATAVRDFIRAAALAG